MKISKTAVSASLAIAGLAISASAFAQPVYTDELPESSVKQCVAEIGEQANYDNAGRVRHVVDSRNRPVSGHMITIDTTVFGADGIEIIREYAATCAVTSEGTTRRFKIKEKSI